MARLLFLFLSLLLSAQSFAAVFGEDNRVNIDDSPYPSMKKSVLAMVATDQLTYAGNELGEILLRPNILSEYLGSPFCSDNRFIEEPSSSDCSGFYIGNGLLMTAGHCVLDGNGEVSNAVTGKCLKNSWVINYNSKNIDSSKYTHLNQQDVFGCQEVVSAAITRSLDYAIIRLNGSVENLIPLKLNKKDELKRGDALSLIGYPSGLPLKFADKGSVYYNSSSSSFIKTDLDSFAGNSGSPVFNDKMEVVGILTGGEVDYAIDEDRGCAQINVCNGVGRLCQVYSGQYGALGSMVCKLSSVFANIQ